MLVSWAHFVLCCPRYWYSDPCCVHDPVYFTNCNLCTVPQTSKHVNFTDKTWKVIEDAINEIHHQNASGLSFEELYRNGYNMVLHKYGERLYNGLKQTLARQLTRIAGEIEMTQGEPFLKELYQRWEIQTKSIEMVRDILMVSQTV